MKRSLEGKKIHLRPFTVADAGALFEAVESSRASLKRRLSWVDGVKGVADEKGFIEGASGFVYGIFENRSKRLAGAASLEVDAEVARARIGFWVRADRRDKGYASEAAGLLAAYGLRKAGLRRIYARLDPANRAFRRVLKKTGLRYEGCLRRDARINGRWIDQECWGLLKSEWKP